MGIFTDEYGELVVWRVVMAAAVAVAVVVAIAVAAFGPKPKVTTDVSTETIAPVAVPTTQPDARDAALEAWLAATEGCELLADLGDEDRRAIMEATESFCGKGETASVLATPRTEGDALVTYLRVERPEGALFLRLTREANGHWEAGELRAVVAGVNDQDETPIPLSDPMALSRLMPEDVAGEVSRQFLASGIESADRAWTTTKGTSTEGDVTRFQIRVPDASGAVSATYDAAYDKAFGMLELYPVAAEVREVR